MYIILFLFVIFAIKNPYLYPFILGINIHFQLKYSPYLCPLKTLIEK